MKRILFISIILFGITAVAQQQIVTTNFLMNDYYYNPAIAGSKDKHVANISYRNQWTGFQGAPVTLFGNFYGSYKNQKKVGYGVSLVSDRNGLTQNTGLYLNYAHHFKLNSKTNLGLGVKPGYMQYRVKLYDAQLADEGDEVLTGNVLSANAFDVQSGFHLYSEKFFVMGSIKHLLGKVVQFTSYNSNLSKHFTLIGGYNLNFEKKKLEVQPSIMLNYVEPVPLQWTGMLKVTFDGKWWAGITYRSQDAAGINFGYCIKDRITVGYGFDYSLSGIRQYQSGSHEIMISFITTPNRPSLDEEDEELNKSIMEDLKKKTND